MNNAKLKKMIASFPLKSSLMALLILLFSVNPSWASQASEGIEQVSFSIPKTLYFTGEKIWLEAKVEMQNRVSPSQVLYAELVDANSNSMDYVKIPLQKGKALNYFSIHSKIPSGNYLLRVYTRISPYLNLEAGIAQQLITIINPTVPPAPQSAIGDQRPSLPQEAFQAKKSSSIPYLAIGWDRSASSFGISIANPFLPEEQKQLSSSQIYQPIESQMLLPELFGHIVEVRVPNSLAESTYFLSVHGSQSALFTDIPNEEGRLLFDIGGLKHWDRMIIQLENGEEMPGIEVVPPLIKTRFKDGFSIPPLVLEEDDLPYLEKLLKASVVEANYQTQFIDDSLKVVTGFVADYTYRLDDYTRFEEVETVLREYVPSVFVRTEQRKKVFRLLDNPGNKVFESNPLILVDAMPVFDSDLLAQFNPKYFSKLEVLNREFFLNERTYAGVLSFSSYQNDLGLFPLANNARFFDYFGLQPLIGLDKGQFSKPAENRRYPDWRTVLYWSSSSPLPASIAAPDWEGLFLIWKRISANDGTERVERTYFRVN